MGTTENLLVIVGFICGMYTLLGLVCGLLERADAVAARGEGTRRPRGAARVPRRRRRPAFKHGPAKTPTGKRFG